MGSEMPIYLSVDFDYFVRELPEWDWGHSEGSSIYSDMAWFTRVRWLEETSLQFADPHPLRFWEKLEELGFDFDECSSFTVTDSHRYAAPDFLHGQFGPVDIVNFDAHHDMGYQEWKVLKKEWIDKNRVDCSNWLLMLLARLPQLKASVVYPGWKGFAEIDDGGKPWDRKGLRERFTYGVYNEEYVRRLAGRVQGIYIAKSSAWMPPWHDQAFHDFVIEGAGKFGLTPEVPFEDEERRNPITPREFDLDAALQHFKAEQEMMKELFAARAARKKASGA